METMLYKLVEEDKHNNMEEGELEVLEGDMETML